MIEYSRMRPKTATVILSAVLVLTSCSTSGSPASGEVNASPPEVDGVEDATPGRSVSDPVVWAIGDSIMVAAEEQLSLLDPDMVIDAETGRRFAAGLDVLEELLASDTPPDVLVFALGTNNGATQEDIDGLLDLAEEIDEIVLVSVVVPRGWEADTNSTILQAAATYSQISFVDWNASAQGQRALFRSDGYHPSSDGASLWAELIAAEVFDS